MNIWRAGYQELAGVLRSLRYDLHRRRAGRATEWEAELPYAGTGQLGWHVEPAWQRPGPRPGWPAVPLLRRRLYPILLARRPAGIDQRSRA